MLLPGNLILQNKSVNSFPRIC